MNPNLNSGILPLLTLILCLLYEPITAVSSTPPTSSDASSSSKPRESDGSPNPPPASSSTPPPAEGSQASSSTPPPAEGSQASSSTPPPAERSQASSKTPPPAEGSQASSSTPPPAEGSQATGSNGAPQSAPQTDDKISTGCTALDKCLNTFTEAFGTSFAYKGEKCSSIRSALECFDSTSKTCGTSYEPYTSINYTFPKLIEEFNAYCPKASNDISTSCDKFNACFAKIKLPSKKNDLKDPYYWCAVIDATQKCGTESDCVSFKPLDESAATIDGYCPNAFDVTKGNFESNGIILAASPILTIGSVALLFVKNWM